MLYKLTQPWPVDRSAQLAAVGLLLVSAYAVQVSRDVLGPNMGHYEIAGVDASLFVLAHLGVALAFAGVAYYDRYREKPSRSLKTWVKRAAITALVIGVVEAIWLIPNGSHVIVI